MIICVVNSEKVKEEKRNKRREKRLNYELQKSKEYLKNKKISYQKIEKYMKKIPLEHRVRYNEKIIENILEEGE